MTTTFDSTLSTARDRMRLALGDTNTGVAKASGTDPMQLPVDDSIYAGLLAYHGNDERKTTLALAEALIAKYAQEPNKATLNNVQSAEWANRLQSWVTTATRLRAEIASAAPRSTGTTVLTQRRDGTGRGEYRRRDGCHPEEER